MLISFFIFLIWPTYVISSYSNSASSTEILSNCPCDADGTIGGPCELPCKCKTGVSGRQCTSCKPGYFNLNRLNSEGCSKCFCFNRTIDCTSSDYGVEWVNAPLTDEIEYIPKWLVVGLNPKKLPVTPMHVKNYLSIANDEMEEHGTNTYYWLAPKEYLGDKLYSYGNELVFNIGYTVLRGDVSGFYFEDADVILQGGPHNVMIGYKWQKYDQKLDSDVRVNISVPLREQEWFKIDQDGRRTDEPVSREEFALITYNLKRMLIRAKFHTDQVEGRIYDVQMGRAVKVERPVLMAKGTEKCNCPEGYTGLSCESCMPGYRMEKSEYGVTCIECPCNKHSLSCDPNCICMHNTTGKDCSFCKEGFYGNPLKGTPDDCKPCNCPPESKCIPTLSGDDYKCYPCPIGYTGDKCDHCDYGYFGNPTAGIACKKCQCAPNIDVFVPGACDPLTGQCRCTKNTWGIKCDECLENHWGNPLTDVGCNSCNCNFEKAQGGMKGALSAQCNKLTGQCQCRSNYAGKHCDRCQVGFGNLALDCPACDCDRVGSISLDCDAETGECPCKPGVTGPRCSECKDEYYGFSEQGCEFCNCDVHGSLSRSCDKETGQCICIAGFKGRDCSQCLPRYVATPDGCVNCDDGICMTLLLDDLDYLFRVLNHTDFSTLKDLPLKKLNYLTGIVEGVKQQVEKYKWEVKSARNKMDNITYSFDIEAFVDILNLKAIDLSNRVPQLVRDVLRVKGDASSLLKIVNDLIDEIIKIVDMLKNYTPYHFLQNIERILIEAEKILIELRKRNYKPNLEESERELRKAMALLEKVQNLLQTPDGHGPLMSQLSKLTSIAYSVLKIVEDQVQKPIVQTIEHVSRGRHSYALIVEAVNNATSLSDIAQNKLANAKQLIEAAKQLFMEINILLKGFPHKFHQLHLRTNTLAELKNTLEQINPQYKVEYVDACTRHADELLKRLDFLKGIFLPSEELSRYALQAASVYQNIIDALNEAGEAARRAYNSAERAYQEAYPQGGKSLIDQVKETLERSLRLMELAKNLRDVKVPELERELHKKMFLIDKITGDLEDSERKMELIIKELERLTISFDEKTRDKSNNLDGILARLEEIHKLIGEYEFKIRNELLPKLERLKDGTPTGIENLTKLIEKARVDIRNSDKLACTAEYRWNKIKKNNDQLLYNLKELRDRILLARQKTTGIRVSLGPNEKGICTRSYQPTIQSSLTNQITLNYATKEEGRNSLLFFIGSNNNQEYMALEMVDRKIRFIWNLGGGAETIEHPQEIETNDQGLTKDQQWYKIEVIRIGNSATLSVKRTPEGNKQDVQQVTSTSPSGYNKFDLDPNALFYIGGLPTIPGVEAPKELKSESFSGCLYELALDGQRIGLWNFKNNIAGCAGCKEGPSEPNESSYQFKREGYAIVPQVSRYDPRKYLIVFQFRTFDKDALLFFAPNLANKDYIAITLENGYLKYQSVAGGGKSKIELKSKNRYNYGQYVKIAAERDRQEVILSVDDEILEATIPGQTTVLLDLSGIQLYYGGVTPLFVQRDWPQIQFKGFIGCIKDVQIDAKPIYFLDVESYGIEPGCKAEHLKTITLLGDAYLELTGKPLKDDTEFSFVFKTHQEDCLLLLSTFEGKNNDKTRDSHYYSVAVVGGRLEARFNGGSGESVIISDGKVNDGIFHSVLIKKKQRRVTMEVDDVAVGVSRLEKGTRDIEASESGGFFIGGIPDNQMTLRGMAATKTKLIGSIKDLMFNNQFTMLTDQVLFENVEFDREYDTLDKIDRTINKIDKIANKEEEENEEDLKPLIFRRP